MGKENILWLKYGWYKLIAHYIIINHHKRSRWKYKPKYDKRVTSYYILNRLDK